MVLRSKAGRRLIGLIGGGYSVKLGSCGVGGA